MKRQRKQMKRQRKRMKELRKKNTVRFFVYVCRTSLNSVCEQTRNH